METKKLKIAFLSAFSGKTHRGAETFVHELANNLAARGHRVVVYQSAPHSTTYAYKSVVVDNNNAQNSHFFVLNFTLRALHDLKADTEIVVPTNGRWQTLLTKLWCVWHHKKMVISGQSGPGLDDRINILCFPNRFVALSSKALLKARSDNGFVKSVLIPNGVNRKKFFPGSTRIKLTIKKPIILCAAALIEKKRINLVINAVSKLKGVSLLIVGEGIMKNRLQALASKKLPGRHQFLQLPYDQMPEVYRAADVFTLVSESSEAFGIVYAEALATNIPVVAPDDVTRREIIGEAGVFVRDSSRVSEYSRAIKQSLDQNWKNIPRSQSERFDWVTISQQYEALFLSL